MSKFVELGFIIGDYVEIIDTKTVGQIKFIHIENRLDEFYPVYSIYSGVGDYIGTVKESQLREV